MTWLDCQETLILRSKLEAQGMRLDHVTQEVVTQGRKSYRRVLRCVLEGYETVCILSIAQLRIMAEVDARSYIDAVCFRGAYSLRTRITDAGKRNEAEFCVAGRVLSESMVWQMLEGVEKGLTNATGQNRLDLLKAARELHLVLKSGPLSTTG